MWWELRHGVRYTVAHYLAAATQQPDPVPVWAAVHVLLAVRSIFPGRPIRVSRPKPPWD